jgi:hypothetical protein
MRKTVGYFIASLGLLIALTTAFEHACLYVGAAYADSGSAGSAADVPSIPDPVSNPVQAVAAAETDYRSYGYVWAGMLVLFAVGTAIVKRSDEETWLSKDHALPIITGLVGVLGAIIEVRFAGASVNVVLSAAMAGVMLVIQKPKPAASAAPAAK